MPAILIQGSRGSVSGLQSTKALCKPEIMKLWNNLLHFTISTSISEIPLKKTKQTISNFYILFFYLWESSQTEISPINLTCEVICEFLCEKRSNVFPCGGTLALSTCLIHFLYAYKRACIKVIPMWLDRNIFIIIVIIFSSVDISKKAHFGAFSKYFLKQWLLNGLWHFWR